MAGPAFAGASFGYNPGHGLTTMEEGFLDHMLDPHSEVDLATNKGRFNSSLDHFSFHFYGDFKMGSSDPAAKPYTTLRYLTNTMRAKLAALGRVSRA